MASHWFVLAFLQGALDTAWFGIRGHSSRCVSSNSAPYQAGIIPGTLPQTLRPSLQPCVSDGQGGKETSNSFFSRLYQQPLAPPLPEMEISASDAAATAALSYPAVVSPSAWPLLPSGRSRTLGILPTGLPVNPLVSMPCKIQNAAVY